MNPIPPDTDPMAQDQPANLQNYQLRSLLALLVAISLAGPIVSTGVYLREGLTPLTWVGIGLTVATWGLLGLFLSGHRKHLPGLLVYLLIFASGIATAAHGTRHRPQHGRTGDAGGHRGRWRVPHAPQHDPQRPAGHRDAGRAQLG